MKPTVRAFMVQTRIRSVPPTALYTSKATALCSDSSSACHRNRSSARPPTISRARSLLRSSSAKVAVKCSRAAVAARFESGDMMRSRVPSDHLMTFSTRLVG